MDQTTLPALPPNIGKRGQQKLPSGRVVPYRIKDEIRVPQTGMPEKILCLQLIEFEKDKRSEVRLAYYIIGKKPRMRGRWVFGQYATFMLVKDFKVLIRRAEKKGWF